MRALLISFVVAFPSFCDAAQVKVSTGQDLESACLALTQHDESDLGIARAETCKQYFTGLMRSAQASVELGGRYEVHRLGERRDETVCFDLSQGLSYEGFATEVVYYSQTHLIFLHQPALELAARALAANHPCPK